VPQPEGVVAIADYVKADFPTNRDRAEWAAAALAAFGECTGQRRSTSRDAEGVQEIVSDLVTDLFHLLRTFGIMPLSVLQRAVHHFGEELAEEDLDGQEDGGRPVLPPVPLAPTFPAALSPPPAPDTGGSQQTITIICVRDPDSWNDFTAFVGDEPIELGKYALPFRVVIHDVDPGGGDLRREEEFCAWAQGHLRRAAQMSPGPARHLSEAVTAYAPEGGIAPCPGCTSPRVAVRGRIPGDPCPWCELDAAAEPVAA
jgi:hypothetical protein